MRNTLLNKNKQILNMYADMNTDQITISYYFLSGLLKAATSLSQWTRASAQKNYHPAGRSSLDGTPWPAAPWSGFRCLWMCAVLYRSHETLATCGASTCSQPQNSPPALGPTRPIFCSASGQCACCIWKQRLCTIKFHRSENKRRIKSVKQVGDLPDGFQQGRFGSAFGCVEDPVRGGQTHWAVTETYQWRQRGLQGAEVTWCGHRCTKWELGFLCLGRNMRWLCLNYVLVAQRRPCSWNSEICCRKSLLPYGKEQKHLPPHQVKPTRQNSELTCRTHIPEISDILVFCHKQVLFVYRVDVNATQSLSVEWVERLVRVPEVTREHNSVTVAQLKHKKRSNEKPVLPWSAPINDGNVSIETANYKSRAVMWHEVKGF